MKKLLLLLPLFLSALLFAGCSAPARLEQKAQVKSDAPSRQFAASIHVLPYTDGRNEKNPRKIGVGAENLSGLGGLHGTDILLDRDAAALVTEAMVKHLADSGYRLVDNGAMFELSGTVRELTYNVKARDEVTISVESTLRDVVSGKLLWSGIVNEQKSRFAGITGDSMADVLAYLNHELGVVTKKTGDQIDGVLMAQHPDLFGIVAGTRVVAGVTVLNAPAPAAASSQAMPAAQGRLMVGTTPQGAKVFIDDVYYGMSPLHLDMDPGIHAVTVDLDGYAKKQQKVSVRKGETTDLGLKLRKR